MVLAVVSLHPTVCSMLVGVKVADNLRLKNVRLQQLVQEEDYQAVYSEPAFQKIKHSLTHTRMVSAAQAAELQIIQAIPQPDMLPAGSSAAR